jgi:uncharacterized protein (TIGR02145 family)
MRYLNTAIFLFLCLSVVAQTAPKKIALVIGAQNYSSLPLLHNSLSDATAMTKALGSKGFEVNAIYDPKTKQEMKDGITWYFNKMKGLTNAVGIIFYAGHGMQYEGDNYIIPTAASLENPGDLDDNCVKMNSVMTVLKASNKSLNILLLDACRSLPSFTRGSDVGLTKMEAPQGSIIVFATQPGQVASDGTGTNGLFTAQFLKAMNEPGLNIDGVFRKVKQAVFEESKSKQLPSVEDNSIGGDFYFTATTAGASAVVAKKAITPEKTTATTTTSTTSKPVKKELTEEQKKEVQRLEKRVKERGMIEPKNALPPQTEIIYATVPKVDFGSGPTTKALKIGKQVWAPVNLNVKHFANGAAIQIVDDGFKWWAVHQQMKPLCNYYDNDSTRGTKFGMLYNWYAVIDPRGLCPTGWHVPTNDEFRELTGLLGDNAGKVLKADDTWQDAADGSPGTGTDDVGFRALPTNHRTMLGTYIPDGMGWYWTSTINTESPMPIKPPSCLSLQASIPQAFHMDTQLYNEMAVRCVKD